MMDDENKKKVDKIIEEITKYSDKLSNLTDEIDNFAISEENEHLGQVSNILKILIGTLESPFMLAEFHQYCENFAAKILLKKMTMNDENSDKFRDELIKLIKK